METKLLDTVAAAVDRVLLAEALALRRCGHDDIPLKESCGATDLPERLANDDRTITQIVQDYAAAATDAVVAIHKRIEGVPQNRPCGATADVERLTLENLNLMKVIVECDEHASRA